ncbi:hypothetical protein [Clostridium tyrobutyricum]|uniref:hypothetical protein n=1 Tax=Clostridium tyrobutyricum TaxID=1519 RepID=UPI001C3854A1|nr:hypothetical protein [Clostridium tyrobutyricum]MBV4416536.1 hypothetical protein [Clostridium tyrobutyricum]
MFNSKLKKEWLDKLEDTKNQYKNEMNSAQEAIVDLFEVRKQAIIQIKQIEKFINAIANTPKEYKVKLNKINLKLEAFNNIANLQNESELATKISGSVAGGGALAGAGLAALGPTAAMAIATTFGTASTGTAIASLSGAAATNAALAWLGGGALAASGGGIAAGNALLALAGPVGWAIGGVSLIGGALFASSKNKEIAEKAESNVYKIKEQINSIIKTKAEIILTDKLTKEHTVSLNMQLSKLSKFLRKATPKIGIIKRLINFIKRLFKKQLEDVIDNNKSYLELSSDLKKELGTLVNNTLSLATLVEKKIG